MRDLTSAAGWLCACAALALPVAVRGEAPLQPERPHHNLYGVTGLIDMPSAEMQPDGQISITSSYFGEYMRNTLSAQIFPGIEAAFRYSILNDFLQGGTGDLYDRSFDIKFRVLRESETWPNVVVGLQDFLGTGIYSAEYLAASKRFFDGSVVLTGGVGWGRLGTANTTENVFCSAIDSFCDRGDFDGVGGEVNFGRFFQGEDMGFFGGIQWDTPIEGLALKVELSSDDYAREEASGQFEREIPVNFGVEYRPVESVEIGAYYVYGSEFGVRLTLSGNPFSPPAPFDTEPAALPLRHRSLPPADAPAVGLGQTVDLVTGTAPIIDYREAGLREVTLETGADGVRRARAVLPPSADDACPAATATGIDADLEAVDLVTFARADGRVVCTVALRPAGERAIRAARRAAADHPTGWHDDDAERARVAEALGAALSADGLDLFGIELFPTRVRVYVENRRFFAMPRAIGRTARALSRTMPASIETFEIVPVENSLPVATIAMLRSDLEDFADQPDGARDVWASATLSEAPRPDWSAIEGTDDLFPRASYSFGPYVPINAFDPDSPLRADLQVLALGTVEVLPGLSASTEVTQRIVGNLDDIERESDSTLPRVRSDIAEYFRTDTPVISRMTGDYVTKVADDTYARLSGGLFERMFGGVGAELLWKPVDQSWGLGAEINWVQQRDFEGYFGFQDYDVFTGHASLYWDTGIYGVAAQVDAGRYLAGDWGGTFSLTRRFANGWEIGAFFTLTDVPFDEFGEGSFDKGITLTIPFNWLLPFEGRSAYSTTIRPVTRDGGQRLIVANRLYPMVRDADRGGLRTRWGGFWE
ncbi:YjbH domain-containing protein [Limibaculum sp. FT325]|uniref:YjbH domain-containing protein n=1 Tax=Thermohalobaculum sediminis TaxID=2939436 RepID=UPI0020C034D4|nr:YjbH domain-containing protein [Limibaculum sediminis]MCL5777810.1 YjbH domain-containing protein [Limibaculum sediminis]